MTIEIKGVLYEPKFTFNSFKYMEDLDLDALQTLDKRPFKLVPFVETLLLGALNHNPRTRVSVIEIDEFLESYIADNNLADLAEYLIGLLQESNFFKSLQKEKSEVKTKGKK